MSWPTEYIKGKIRFFKAKVAACSPIPTLKSPAMKEEAGCFDRGQQDWDIFRAVSPSR